MYMIYKKILADYNGGDKKKQDSYYLLFIIYRHLSFPIAAILIYLGISANTVTVIGATVWFASGVSFLFIDNISIYLPLFLYWLAWILDFVDGTIARYNSSSNYFGKIIDGFVDYLSILLFLPIAYGNIKAGGSIFVENHEFLIAMIGVMSCHAAMYYDMRVGYFRLEMATQGGEAVKVPVTALNRVSSVKNIVSYFRGNTIAARPMLLLMAIVIDAISYFIVFYAVFYFVCLCLDIVYKTITAHNLSDSTRAL